ncbi:hypothetical protein TRVL_06704 [Trypanosoma vivax]|nr:hypothetical protein TRVL_06704 [Trypanosoma vivax]
MKRKIKRRSTEKETKGADDRRYDNSGREGSRVLPCNDAVSNEKRSFASQELFDTHFHSSTGERIQLPVLTNLESCTPHHNQERKQERQLRDHKNERRSGATGAFSPDDAVTPSSSPRMHSTTLVNGNGCHCSSSHEQLQEKETKPLYSQCTLRQQGSENMVDSKEGLSHSAQVHLPSEAIRHSCIRSFVSQPVQDFFIQSISATSSVRNSPVPIYPMVGTATETNSTLSYLATSMAHPDSLMSIVLSPLSRSASVPVETPSSSRFSTRESLTRNVSTSQLRSTRPTSPLVWQRRSSCAASRDGTADLLVSTQTCNFSVMLDTSSCPVLSHAQSNDSWTQIHTQPRSHSSSTVMRAWSSVSGIFVGQSDERDSETRSDKESEVILGGSTSVGETPREKIHSNTEIVSEVAMTNHGPPVQIVHRPPTVPNRAPTKDTMETPASGTGEIDDDFYEDFDGIDYDDGEYGSENGDRSIQQYNAMQHRQRLFAPNTSRWRAARRNTSRGICRRSKRLMSDGGGCGSEWNLDERLKELEQIRVTNYEALEERQHQHQHHVCADAVEAPPGSARRRGNVLCSTGHCKTISNVSGSSNGSNHTNQGNLISVRGNYASLRDGHQSDETRSSLTSSPTYSITSVLMKDGSAKKGGGSKGGKNVPDEGQVHAPDEATESSSLTLVSGSTTGMNWHCVSSLNFHSMSLPVLGDGAANVSLPDNTIFNGCETGESKETQSLGSPIPLPGQNGRLHGESIAFEDSDNNCSKRRFCISSRTPRSQSHLLLKRTPRSTTLPCKHQTSLSSSLLLHFMRQYTNKAPKKLAQSCNVLCTVENSPSASPSVEGRKQGRRRNLVTSHERHKSNGPTSRKTVPSVKGEGNAQTPTKIFVRSTASATPANETIKGSTLPTGATVMYAAAAYVEKNSERQSLRTTPVHERGKDRRRDRKHSSPLKGELNGKTVLFAAHSETHQLASQSSRCGARSNGSSVSNHVTGPIPMTSRCTNTKRLKTISCSPTRPLSLSSCLTMRRSSASQTTRTKHIFQSGSLAAPNACSSVPGQPHLHPGSTLHARTAVKASPTSLPACLDPQPQRHTGQATGLSRFRRQATTL